MKRPKRKYMVSNINPNLSTDEKTKILKNFSIFEGVSGEVVSEFALKMRASVIHPLEIFVEEGFDDHFTYFVYKGVASLFRTTGEGEIINIDVVGAPTIVGMSGLIDNKKSSTSAMAIDEIQTFVLDQRDFQEMIPNYPKLTLNMMKLFAQRMHRFDIFIEELISKNLRDRTWQLLQYLSHYFADDEITLSHEEIADLVWGTRSRVTEVLNTLEKEGKISVGHRKVKIL
jgi:CRP/FNR family transcriptional regulator